MKSQLISEENKRQQKERKFLFVLIRYRRKRRQVMPLINIVNLDPRNAVLVEIQGARVLN